MKQIPNNVIDCCITSPPYWGLRDYGTAKWEGGDPNCDHKVKTNIKEPNGDWKRPSRTESNKVGELLECAVCHKSFVGKIGNKFCSTKCFNTLSNDERTVALSKRVDTCRCGAKRIDNQLGLEKTPEEYVAKMLNVFHEVKRILKPQGTLWLNLGDSYFTRTGTPGYGWERPSRKETAKIKDLVQSYKTMHPILKSKDLVGIPWAVAFALQSPYEEHLIKSAIDRAYIAGLVDGEGCITILETKSSHCESYSYPPIVKIRMCDTEAIDYFASLIGVNRSEAELYNSSKEANQRPSYNVKATSQKAMDLIADIYPYLRVKRKQAIIAYNHQLFRSNRGNQERKNGELEKEQFCKNLINKLNQREEIDIPSWMIEPKFKVEQGWFLRQDLIWHKPNPMPESVTDRCTKSHEYIFLLAKSRKYYFDNDAIKDPLSNPYRTNFQSGSRPNGDNPDRNDNDLSERSADVFYESRNKRSVWTIATKSFRDAHFATFPEDLINPMVLAGCPVDGIIIDPFMGAGTTALVSKKLNRNYIGIEINPNYIEIANKRINVTEKPLF